jgi:hypothetical protein
MSRLCLREFGLILICLQGDMFAEMASQLMNRRLSMKGGLQSGGKEEVSRGADTFRSGFRNSLLGKAGAEYGKHCPRATPQARKRFAPRVRCCIIKHISLSFLLEVLGIKRIIMFFE